MSRPTSPAAGNRRGSRRRRAVGSRTARQAWGAAAGVLADQVLGEPRVPDQVHPVALFGRAALGLERGLYDGSRWRGAVYTSVATGMAAGAGVALGRLGPFPSTAAASYLSVSGRALHEAAERVRAALAGDDLDAARQWLTHLVGRDPTGLGAAEVARAVVESVAENTTDAVVAPALWAAAAGPPGVLAQRAVDTLDSMVGYRNEAYTRFGTASARTDDVMAWVPARATGALVCLVRPHLAGKIRQAVCRDARAHPSPNAGVAEAAFAAALGLQLGGTNRYGTRTEHRPTLGDGRPPGPADIGAAVKLSRDVTWALIPLLAGLGVVTPILHGS